VTVLPPLPRRDGYTPPDWWQPHIAEFPRWRAWHGASQFWARLCPARCASVTPMPPQT
jgi:hypothetical protein